MTTVNEAHTILTTNAFKAEDKRPERDYMIVCCKHCNIRWSLGIRNDEVDSGNLLALLDHAGAHMGKQ